MLAPSGQMTAPVVQALLKGRDPGREMGPGSGQDWPGLFPTISGVRLISRDGPRLALEVDHVEGTVRNELILRCPDEIDLWEVKRRYDACFRNRFVTIPGGTLFVVTGEVWLKGWARLLRPAAYLLRSPENARRLLASIDRLEHGGGIERDLLE